MTNVALIEQLTDSDFETIEELASQNIGPSDIAKSLSVNTRTFLRVWRDDSSSIREAYERGRMEIHIRKMRELSEQAEGGNQTAIQIHNKMADDQKFEDIKRQIFQLNG